MIGELIAAAVPVELVADEGFLTEVFAFVFFLVYPKVGIHLAYFPRHESGKNGVAGVLGGGGQNAEVEAFVYVELLGQLGSQHAPLVEAQVVEYEKEHFLPRRQARKNLPLKHIGTHHGAFLGMGHPALVIAPDKFGKCQVGFFLLHPQHLSHRTVGTVELQFPVDETFVKFCPFSGAEILAHLYAYPSELPPIARLYGFLLYLMAVDVLLECEKYLLGVDGFEQIVCNLRSDGLVHEVFGLVLGDHHHRYIGAYVLYSGQRLKAAQAWHVLVQKNKVEGAVAAQLNRIGAVGARGHLITFVL